MLSGPTDRDIVDAIRSGEPLRVNWAMERVYAYRDYATSFMKKNGSFLPGLDNDTARDVFQDTIITFMEKVWDGSYEVRPNASLKTYLYHIAHNKLRNVYKSTRSRMENGNQYARNELTEPLMPDEKLEEKERHALFEKAMKQLGETKAALIRMFDFEQKSHREIGEILEISETAAKQKYYRSRLEFIKILRTYGDFD